MSTEPKGGNPGGTGGRPAVLYVGPDVDAGDVEEARSSEPWLSVGYGSSDTTATVRSPEEVDAFVAEHPGALILVHPGEERPALPGEPGDVLWNFLRAGFVLLMCGADEAGPVPSVPGPPLRQPAFLLLDWPRSPAREGVSRPSQWEREQEVCRTVAEAHGLRVVHPLTDNASAWLHARRVTLGPRRSFEHTPTVLLRRDLTPPPSGSPDVRLWRWLRQGLVIRSWRPRRRLLESALDLEDQGATTTADRAAPDEEPPAARRGALRRSRPSGVWLGGGEDVLEKRVSNRAHVGPRGRLVGGLARGTTPPAHPHAPRDTSLPLPPDGLYVRRNNAFGTRSSLGVKELIEQGVIVGQEHIRFDDFVVSRDGQVPGPAAGEAIGVSHGLAAVTGEFKANEATTHFVEIALKAGPTPTDPTPAAEPLPVNFVFVVDTSGSMSGEKLDTVKSALHTIYGQLRPADCLGIIAFDHGVRTVLSAATKAELEESGSFAAAVSGLYAHGGTDLNLGVQYGIDEIGRNAVSGRTVNCLYLFSDGDPTSGERNWVNIRRNAGARVRDGFTLSCFGFGSDARMPELSALAGVAGGHSTFVTRPEQVKADLQQDLDRRDHLAAVDIQLRLDIDPAVEIRHVYGHDPVTDPRDRAKVFRQARQAAERARSDYGAEALPDIITDERGIRIFAPDLAFEETYWVVLEVRVPAERKPAGLGTATVQYVDTLARESRQHEIDLARDATLTAETVLVHGVGLWTSEVTFHALDDLYEHDREAARRRLERHLQALDAAHAHLPAPEFRDDKVTLRKFLSLADSLGTAVSFSDSPTAGAGHTVQLMNTFGRVRSGFSARH
ncbi:VWA domain-containing protein [Streptomyces sp. NEAU-NA10]|uniref:VWA domain-containing protein n=1 Tax=Streptomyces sp. NEAU-NA10 TaxID=3416050 RepID=UPI003CC55272